MKYLNLLLFGLLLVSLQLAADEPQWLTKGDSGTQVHLYFFWSPTCPHCQEARPAIEKMVQENSWLILHSGDVINDPQQLQRYRAMAIAVGETARSVPGFFICNKMFVGWDSAAGVGRLLLQTAEQCRQRGLGEASSAEPTMPGGIDAEDYSLPLFTLLIAGMDAFNPCAFFVLLFLLSLMVNARSRQRMLLVGGTFVLVSGTLYFVFMAAWLNLFLMIGALGWINWVAGLVAISVGLFGIKDFLLTLRGPSLSIPDAAKPKLYKRIRDLIATENIAMLLLGSVTLAIAANSYELLCTAGFPMIYTRVLTMRQLGDAEYYLYLLLYNIIYVIPLLLIVVGFVVTLGGHKLSMQEGRLLKLLSGIMMFGLGAVLLLRPELLSNIWTGAGLLIVALVITLLARLRLNKR
jgi:thiol-disulfide isomerase/thioredoxin